MWALRNNVSVRRLCCFFFEFERALGGASNDVGAPPQWQRALGGARNMWALRSVGAPQCERAMWARN
jgi:hypothetical protein